MQTGVCQGGVLSPTNFNITLESILRKNKHIRRMLNQGQIIAFADDLIIATTYEDKVKIRTLIEHLDAYGLKTNPDKCKWIGPCDDDFVSSMGQFDLKCKYLGSFISYSSKEAIRLYKNSLRTNSKKIKKVTSNLRFTVGSRVEQALFRTLSLYQLTSSLVSREITYNDLKGIIKTAERSLHVFPGGVNYELYKILDPRERLDSWLRRTIQKSILKLRRNEQISSEVCQWVWKDLDSRRYTS